MNKYRVTKEHPFIKECIITAKDNNIFIPYNYCDGNHEKVLHVNDSFISIWLNNGWVEEVEEPEFTESDVKKIVKGFTKEYVMASHNEGLDELINEYLKDKS